MEVNGACVFSLPWETLIYLKTGTTAFTSPAFPHHPGWILIFSENTLPLFFIVKDTPTFIALILPEILKIESSQKCTNFLEKKSA